MNVISFSMHSALGFSCNVLSKDFNENFLRFPFVTYSVSEFIFSGCLVVVFALRDFFQMIGGLLLLIQI